EPERGCPVATSLACPNLDELLALHRGELDSESASAIREHLDCCSSCKDRLSSNLPTSPNQKQVPRLFLSIGILAELFHSEVRLGPQGPPAAVMKGDSPRIPHSSKVLNTPLTKLPGKSIVLPARLGKYRLTEELGRGGMGVVYAAVHINLNKPVAVK